MTIKSSCLRQIETLSMQCFCGVFVVFELNTKIKPFIKNFYEKIGIGIFNIQTNHEHSTLDSIFFYTNEQSGGSNLVHWGGWWRRGTWLPPWTGTLAAPGRTSLAGSESVAVTLEAAGILESSKISKP